ncbi:ABC transporter ATP-binding protein [Paenibacillus aceris]|uniref:Peptide/nickel transport system ATP-binding protein n=1 Tax=Paenibacillus aceris TaxID=869555 RepID=A0ABS4I247_9BACL|nr:ABC transporter ATP-binding protein [Paenibacillus aceris]MBP1964977.1 peptide/nickel transport system ATP-binding protein [Paenibacillus aceris]NHW35638.1 ABC transporter ATP-binding protein [Paenibacillus aceris]
MADLLRVHNLSIEYASSRGVVKAVDEVSFSIGKGEIFGLAGESGCGKSTTAFGICRLLRHPAKITGGSVQLAGTELMALSDEEFDRLRWSKMSIVLQSAMNNLNPVLKIRDQLADTILAHEPDARKEVHQRAEHLMRLVDLPVDRLDSYPHELSGGMRQRVVIAMAMALKPSLVIMDEPTTALDVVVQNGIIRKIMELQKEFGFSILFITHDLPLMLEMCDRIGIMYAGKLVEVTAREQILHEPRHPYTQGLLNSFPSLSGPKPRLAGIPGHTPDLIRPPAGCRFYPRCSQAVSQCQTLQPTLLQDKWGQIACHLYSEEGLSREQASAARE